MHIYATEGQTENSQNSPMTTEVTISEVNIPQKTGQYSQRPWRSRESGKMSLKIDNFQPRTQNEDNRQLPRGSYTHILVNPTQMADARWQQVLPSGHNHQSGPREDATPGKRRDSGICPQRGGGNELY